MMKTFELGGFIFTAEDCIDSILLNPLLPDSFDNTPHRNRPVEQVDAWRHRPFVVTHTYTEWPVLLDEKDEQYRRSVWFRRWPTGIRYSVRCLDFRSEGRSTIIGHYKTLDIAIEHASACLPFQARAVQTSRVGEVGICPPFC